MKYSKVKTNKFHRHEKPVMVCPDRIYGSLKGSGSSGFILFREIYFFYIFFYQELSHHLVVIVGSFLIPVIFTIVFKKNLSGIADYSNKILFW